MKKDLEELKWYEYIRLRPGMYIGQVNERGFIYTLQEVLSAITAKTNSKQFKIELIGKSAFKLTFDHQGGDLDNNWSKISLTNNRVSFLDLFVLNALSKVFKISFWDSDKKKIYAQQFKEGVLIEGEVIDTINCASIDIELLLDDTIWGEDFSWNTIYITQQLREFAYLNKHTRFNISYQEGEEACKLIYHFKNGLKDRIDIELLDGLGGSYFATSIDQTIGNIHIELAFAFRDYSVDTPYLQSYVNNYQTSEHGTHVDGLLKGLTYGVMQYFQKHQLVHQYKISEKGIQENLVAAINIKMAEPVFSGCVKNKLANAEVLEPIAKHVAACFFEAIEQDEKATQRLIRKFEM